MWKKIKIVPAFLVFSIPLSCSLFSCSKTSNYFDIVLMSNNTPITISQTKAAAGQDLDIFLNTIKTNIVIIQNIQINGDDIDSKNYVFDSESGHLHIDKEVIKGNIKISALSKEQKFNISKSDTSSDDVNFSCDTPTKNVELVVNLNTKQPISNYSLNSVTVNNVLLDSNNYFFDTTKSQIKIMGKYITGDIIFDINLANEFKKNNSPFHENELHIEGGSIQLYGLPGRYGADEKRWKITLDTGEDITVDCQLTVLGSSGNVQISSDGMVFWSQLESGIYHLQVHAIYDKKPGITLWVNSPQIILNISPEGYLTGGNTNLAGTLFYAGHDYASWKFISGTQDVTNETIFSLEDAPNGVTFSTKNHKIFWNNLLAEGEYKFKLKAEFQKQSLHVFAFSYITLTINSYFNISGGSKIIDASNFTFNSDFKFWSCFFTNGFVFPKWEIENDSSQKIFIDRNGLVSWDSSLPQKDYNFNVKATYFYNNILYEARSEVITLKL